MAEVIEFNSEVYKVQTLVDGGIRLTLDLPETAIEAAAKLMTCRKSGVYLAIVATPFVRESLTQSDDATQEGAEARASQVDRRRSIKHRDQRTGD